MESMLLNHFTLCSGVGHAIGQHNAFDRALIEAGVSDYNLIKISSILPPQCIQEDKILLSKGSLLPTAIASISSNNVGMRLSAAIAIGIPQDSHNIGIIMEHCTNLPKEETEELACTYACQAMKDRYIKIKNIVSVSTECCVEIPEYYCAFAAVSLW